ncbi:hypothetical protein FZEAL_7106 [Fusarium zealandicum]|uniref:BTB domain-containing protein n=1 Tax=Fusarium zealandicum TaxID=1053134 RepID=A0A8H4UH66_9HYPO|nr:hypothetical protein FZEAL_7106 [Fusarium zealandicum]
MEAQSVEASGSTAREPKMLQLYPNGDAIVVVHHPTKQSLKCLVSSIILRAASPYFDALFGSDFKEGASVRQGNCPEITLQEDDPDAMEIILSALHFKYSSRFTSLTPAELASVARQSDKYTCNGALQPWISTWLSTIEDVADPKDAGLLLTAAYFFRSPESISIVSRKAIPHLNLDFEAGWSKDQTTAALPFEIKDALQTCTVELRIAAYFNILEKHHLWPSVQAFKIHTVSGLEKRIKRVSEDREHHCDAGTDCPLYKVLWAMPDTISTIIGEIPGISLEESEEEHGQN